ncbi:hypothetical protein HYX70_01745 [Candidatus Saccharibacteria bacterium]|nr:hypothetical protein [Candidatus Saccharibacteria bacterium]
MEKQPSVHDLESKNSADLGGEAKAGAPRPELKFFYTTHTPDNAKTVAESIEPTDILMLEDIKDSQQERGVYQNALNDILSGRRETAERGEDNEDAAFD